MSRHNNVRYTTHNLHTYLNPELIAQCSKQQLETWPLSGDARPHTDQFITDSVKAAVVRRLLKH